jgi:hypothetical protein
MVVEITIRKLGEESGVVEGPAMKQSGLEGVTIRQQLGYCCSFITVSLKPKKHPTVHPLTVQIFIIRLQQHKFDSNAE